MGKRPRQYWTLCTPMHNNLWSLIKNPWCYLDLLLAWLLETTHISDFRLSKINHNILEASFDALMQQWNCNMTQTANSVRSNVTIHIPIDWQARYPRRSSVFLQFGIGWGAQSILECQTRPEQTRSGLGFDPRRPTRFGNPDQTETHHLGKDARPRHKTNASLGQGCIKTDSPLRPGRPNLDRGECNKL